MTLCTSIDTLAMAYLDDELADEELRDFELHLIDCAACRGRVDAERDTIAELRRRLAPPPTPDLVRARLRAVLDAEDAAVAVTERRARTAGWLLPGVASSVAVAALILFIALRPDSDTRHDPVAAAVVGGPMQQLQFNGTLPTNTSAGTGHVDIFRMATWQEQFQGRAVTKQIYRVTLPSGFQVGVQAAIFDARGLDFDEGDRVVANGYELRVVTSQTGQYAVSYRAADGVGYVFMAPELSPQDLVELVGGDLIDQVGARMHQ